MVIRSAFLDSNIIENPVQFSEELANIYCKSNTNERKSLGQYFTPEQLAIFMAQITSTPIKKKLVVLDPGIGTGTLASALCVHLSSYELESIHLVGYEIDNKIIDSTHKVLEALLLYLKNKKIKFSYEIRNKDFVIDKSDFLNRRESDSSLFSQKNETLFDYIISNPPYFKISKSDLRSELSSQVVHGQTNIYSLFMAISASLLADAGEMVFIVPRSFTSGFYFKRFRLKFLELVTPTYFHIFDSRKLAFKKDDVLQENIIIKAKKEKSEKNSKVLISTSNGLDDISKSKIIHSKLSNIIDMKSDHKYFHIPTSKEDELLLKIFSKWSGNLEKYGLQISTGPVVQFRAEKFLKKAESSNASPLLMLHNVKQMNIKWPIINGKPQYIHISKESNSLLVKNQNYILLRRFSAKEDSKRMVAAPFVSRHFNFQNIGIENHLNYIYKINGCLMEEEVYGISQFLCSELANNYFRIFNGNTQVSATEIRAMPLPSYNLIIELGKIVKEKLKRKESADDLIVDLHFFEKIESGLIDNEKNY